jgi:hypothetical protein
MAGLLPLVTSFAKSRLHLGYRCAALCEDGPLGPSGSRFRGHEFHYATVVREDGAAPFLSVSDAAGTDLGACGLRRGSVFGSFIHLIDRCDERESASIRGSDSPPLAVSAAASLSAARDRWERRPALREATVTQAAGSRIRRSRNGQAFGL